MFTERSLTNLHESPAFLKLKAYYLGICFSSPFLPLIRILLHGVTSLTSLGCLRMNYLLAQVEAQLVWFSLHCIPLISVNSSMEIHALVGLFFFSF